MPTLTTKAPERGRRYAEIGVDRGTGARKFMTTVIGVPATGIYVCAGAQNLPVHKPKVHICQQTYGVRVAIFSGQIKRLRAS
jgi:hypothetical protein